MNRLTEYLQTLGVENILFCAGARNSFLVDELSSFKQSFYIDERSASFRALGFSKYSKKPTVICTTSGTAVSECLSAFIEAYYGEVSLIVLSADRPNRLQDTHAPQTIDQKAILQRYARTKIYDFESFNLKPEYPIHINLEIEHLKNNYSVKINNIDENEFIRKWERSNLPVAVFTDGDSKAKKQFEQLNSMGCPIYIECTSAFAGLKINNPISFESQFIDLYKDKKFDLVLKFGFTPFNKVWRLLDSAECSVEVVSVLGEKLGIPHGSILNNDKVNLPERNFTEIRPYKDLNSYLARFPESEASVFSSILAKIPNDDIIYVGNSMPIRYVQMTNLNRKIIYASRGANGIDGQISTAIGMAMATSKNVHCLIGDLTFLYDIGALLDNFPENLFIHVINNQGGRIFERVSVHKKMIIEHDQNISHLVANFPKSKQVIEYHVNNDQTDTFWKEWLK